MSRDKFLKEIRTRLSAVYHERLMGVVLYGSEARGQARLDSDIDVLVLLNGPVYYGRDLETNINALYDLSVDIGRRISAKPVAASEYETLDCPMYQNVHREGIVI